MSIDIRLYTDEHRDEWEKFVFSANNGTIFHRQKFLSYHPEERFQFKHLMFYHENKLIALLPGGVNDSRYNSPTGASFGGFVLPKMLKFDIMDDIVKCFIDYCKAEKISSIRITPPMQIYSGLYDEVMEYALMYNKFTCSNSLYSSVIDLQEVGGRENFSRSARYGTNKAERLGIRVEQSNLYGEAYAILVENKKKFRTTPTHSLQELEHLHQHFPHDIKLFVATYNNEPIAASWIFVTNEKCGLIFYAVHLYEYRKLYALNLILEQVIRWCKQKGLYYLDYGVSADTFHPDPMEPSRSLVRFKESVGCTGCLRKTYILKIV